MCTAVSLKTGCHYFGRNLDLEFSRNESVVITPRHYAFHFRMAGDMAAHFAMIGICIVPDEDPLYYEAVNEAGLGIAGLNFPEFAHYSEISSDQTNIAPFELIPWVLGQCKSVREARACIQDSNIAAIPYSEKLPLTPLHWMIADAQDAIAVECTIDGTKIFDDPAKVMTNSPGFDYHMLNLCQYMGVSAQQVQNRFSNAVSLHPFSRGMGGFSLPGDYSSASRFVRAAFVRLNSVCDAGEPQSVAQFFHILDSVAHPRGCVDVNGDYQITIYSCCCNTDTGVFYYKTYENSAVTAVDMRLENLDGSELICYPMLQKMRIFRQNAR